MKEIVNRLQENRQIKLAKSILESKGYSVSKRLKESLHIEGDGPASEIMGLSEGEGGDPECDELIEDCAKKVGMDLSKCVCLYDINNFDDYLDREYEDEYVEEDWKEELLVSYQEGGYYSVSYYESKDGIKALQITSRDAMAFAIVQNA